MFVPSSWNKLPAAAPASSPEQGFLPEAGSDTESAAEPLLKPSRKIAKAQAFDPRLIVIVALPWGVFSLLLGLFGFCAEEFAPCVWVVVIMTVFLALGLLSIGLGANRPAHLATGCLVLVAGSLGCGFGRLADQTYMREFWGLENGAEYFQVSPTSRGASFYDAGIIEFVPGVQVDVKHSLGMLHLGKTYCVAPILSKGNRTPSSSPQFWAVGQDCCQVRGSFQCGDISSRRAHAGLAVPDDTGNFEKAAKMATSTYKLGTSASMPSTTPMFVRWTADVKAYKEELWISAGRFALTASGVYLVGSALAGVLLSRRALQE